MHASLRGSQEAGLRLAGIHLCREYCLVYWLRHCQSFFYETCLNLPHFVAALLEGQQTWITSQVTELNIQKKKQYDRPARVDYGM
jgi:hypothetical protein